MQFLPPTTPYAAGSALAMLRSKQARPTLGIQLAGDLTVPQKLMAWFLAARALFLFSPDLLSTVVFPICSCSKRCAASVSSKQPTPPSGFGHHQRLQLSACHGIFAIGRLRILMNAPCQLSRCILPGQSAAQNWQKRSRTGCGGPGCTMGRWRLPRLSRAWTATWVPPAWRTALQCSPSSGDCMSWLIHTGAPARQNVL